MRNRESGDTARMTRLMVLALLAAMALLPACTCSRPHATETAASALITDRQQLDAAVGSIVTIVGVQTRTKIPTVCGVDVDGADELADHKVIVRGVLHRDVVTEASPTAANRGNGTFYSVVDPATGQLAKTAPDD
jgi:hypothetical protein